MIDVVSEIVVVLGDIDFLIGDCIGVIVKGFGFVG